MYVSVTCYKPQFLAANLWFGTNVQYYFIKKYQNLELTTFSIIILQKIYIIFSKQNKLY